MLQCSQIFDERISFAEATERLKLSKAMARAFRDHCRLYLTFDYRSEDGWRSVYAMFAVADRRRK